MGMGHCSSARGTKHGRPALEVDLRTRQVVTSYSDDYGLPGNQRKKQLCLSPTQVLHLVPAGRRVLVHAANAAPRTVGHVRRGLLNHLRELRGGLVDNLKKESSANRWEAMGDLRFSKRDRHLAFPPKSPDVLRVATTSTQALLRPLETAPRRSMYHSDRIVT